jgi:hypothetical protein
VAGGRLTDDTFDEKMRPPRPPIRLFLAAGQPLVVVAGSAKSGEIPALSRNGDASLWGDEPGRLLRCADE